MSRVTWDQIGEKTYETGASNGVLYPQDEKGFYTKGEAWNGLTGVTESPSGAEPTALYANNVKYLSLLSAETFGATIKAYAYPPSFEECDGSAELIAGVSIGQQKRKAFGLTYQTVIGNDVDNNDHGYKLHIIYGELAAPSERDYESINDSPEAIEMSWEVSTTPVPVTGKKATATLVIDSTKVDAKKLKVIEDVLYGTDHTVLATKPDDWDKNYASYFIKSGDTYKAVTASSGNAPSWEAGKYYSGDTEPRLPLPDEIVAIMSAA